MRRIITASDVEIVSITGKRTLYVDSEDIVTNVAREMAAKLGVKIAEGLPPQDEVEVTRRLPSSSSPSVQDESKNPLKSPGSSQVWIPREFSGESKASGTAEEKLGGIVLRNGRIVWPGQGSFMADIHISGGKIASIHRRAEGLGGQEIDVSGKYVLPGIIDPHVHLGIFAPFDTDAKDETKAGLWGGVTSLGCYLYEKGSYVPKLEELYKKVEKYSSADIFFHVTISTEEQLKEIPLYINEYGIRSFKIYMCGVPGIIPDTDDSFMIRVYEKLAQSGSGFTVCIHAENASLVRWATEEIAAKDGMKTSVQEWSETHPAIAEEEAIRRAAFLRRGFENVSTYFVHVSTKGGIEAVSKIKCEAENIFAETTSPYLLFAIEEVKGNLPKWLPPLRDKESQEALWEKVKLGKVDSLGTDSVPMSRDIKGLEKSVWEAMPNAPSMEHHLPGILSEGVANRGISIVTLVDLMTRRPAEIFGIFPCKGILWPGADADLVVVDIEKWQRVGKEQIRSALSFSLFEGRVLTGWPEIVIKGGKLVVKDGHWVDDPPPARALNEKRKKLESI